VGLITTHVIQIRLDRGQEESETKTDLLNMTTALANFTGQAFGTVDQGLSRFSANLELSTPPGVVHETLRAARDSSLAVREIFVTDAEGNLIASSYSLSPERHNLANEPPFMTPIARGEKSLRISPPLTGYLGRGSGETILRLARPRREADGTFAGWIVGTLNVDHFRGMFNSLSVTPHTVIGLFRSDGVLLTSNVNETYGVIGPGTREGLFRKHLGNGTASGAFWSDEDSVERSLIVYTRVPDLPLILVAATPEEEVYAEWQARALTASLIVLALAAFIVTATMAAIRTLQLRQREQIEMTRRLDSLALASVELTRERSRDRVLSRTAAIARELVPSHQCVVSLTLAEDASQQVHTVSLSEKYSRWRDYAEQSDGSGIYRLVCETNKPMRLSQSELEEHPAWLGFGASS
jgi:hypothetical protein